MIRRVLPIFLVLILALSVGGVYAGWLYADEPIESQEGAMGVNISVFDYTPEEILPENFNSAKALYALIERLDNI